MTRITGLLKNRFFYLVMVPAVIVSLIATLPSLRTASSVPSFSPFLDQGPGGPILVIVAQENPFTRYYSEILHAEGLNAFAVEEISSVSASVLRDHKIAILGEMPLTADQVGMFEQWVRAGGKLVAMRPDKQLAPLLGFTDTQATLSNAYMLAKTTGGPGVGLVNQTLQFHGTADLYLAADKTKIATLYSGATNATPYPALTLQHVGLKGGQAAAFTYDLARSIVYTRQGNPVWSGQRRDGLQWRRSDDLYFGGASFDPQPDWVDSNKIALPQADEQQRLFANLIADMMRAEQPMPRFWYFPNAKKAVIVMTGDDHGNGGTRGRFDAYAAASPPGCSVAKWECIRSTSYIYPSTPISEEQAATYDVAGFEIALHLRTNPSDWIPREVKLHYNGLFKLPKVEVHGCADWTPASLQSFLSVQLKRWGQKYSRLPRPSTLRAHCVVWSDYASQPEIELQQGIRLDTDYYYYPGSWVRNRPGLFTGSGIPMRFSDRNGNVIDVYQATTQMTDESEQSYPYTADSLLDNALGPSGFYAALVVNAHTDSPKSQVSDAVIASALARAVPVVSARQMLTWLDGRNNSSFEPLSWDGRNLSFTTKVDSGAQGLLEAMVPTDSVAGTLSRITLNGTSIGYRKELIKGVEYAFFRAVPEGHYIAKYLQPGLNPR